MKLLAKCCLCVGILSFLQEAVLSQVVPDNTLEGANSSVTPVDQLRNRILGGSVQGSNLFHSFKEFSVGEGKEVYFASPNGIVNIFSRVTGGAPSTIAGTLGVDGTANLFLLNPNGIVFGENSAIDVSGSFLATTASQVIFEDNSVFQANAEQVAPLLTVRTPIGLGFNGNSEAIAVQGAGHQLRLADTSSIASAAAEPLVGAGQRQSGLFLSGGTFALIGNGVTLDGGILTNSSGHIEIGSLSSGVVGVNLLSNRLAFDYAPDTSFQNVTLNNSALIDVSGSPGGYISLRGQNLELFNNSYILNSNFGSMPAEAIRIYMNGSINLVGFDSPSFLSNFSGFVPGISTQAFGEGNGSDLFITAKELSISNSAVISSLAASSSDGGDINISIDDSIEVIGEDVFPFITALSTIFTLASSSGKGGDINIAGNYLSLESGSYILSQALQTGEGGSIFANVDEIDVVGASLVNFPVESYVPSTIGTTTASFAPGGDVSIGTEQVELSGGARINATTSGFGAAGDIVVNAKESILVSGETPGTGNNELIGSSQITASAEIPSPLFVFAFNLPPVPEGKTGSVTLNSQQIVVDNQGLISVNNQGIGDAGNIELDASTILLTNDSQISASTEVSGFGGDIFISGDAIIGTNNSDITANSIGGEGGTIAINGSLFGFTLREEVDDLTTEQIRVNDISDIAAFSDRGIESEGDIIVDSNFDLQDRLALQTLDVVSAEDLVATSCLERDRPAGSFSVVQAEAIPDDLPDWEPTQLPVEGVRLQRTTAGEVAFVSKRDRSCLETP